MRFYVRVDLFIYLVRSAGIRNPPVKRHYQLTPAPFGACGGLSLFTFFIVDSLLLTPSLVTLVVRNDMGVGPSGLALNSNMCLWIR